MKTKTVNNVVCCEPPASLSIKIERQSGFATAAQKTSLLKLKVLAKFEDLKLNVGDYIYISYENTSNVWLKSQYALPLDSTKSCVLVPSSSILFVETNE